MTKEKTKRLTTVFLDPAVVSFVQSSRSFSFILFVHLFFSLITLIQDFRFFFSLYSTGSYGSKPATSHSLSMFGLVFFFSVFQPFLSQAIGLRSGTGGAELINLSSSTGKRCIPKARTKKDNKKNISCPTNHHEYFLEYERLKKINKDRLSFWTHKLCALGILRKSRPSSH